jgi:hypothetical protein
LIGEQQIIAEKVEIPKVKLDIAEKQNKPKPPPV